MVYDFDQFVRKLVIKITNENIKNMIIYRLPDWPLFSIWVSRLLVSTNFKLSTVMGKYKAKTSFALMIIVVHYATKVPCHYRHLLGRAVR